MTETLRPLADAFPAADEEQWRALVEKVLKGADFDKRLVSRSLDGVPIRPVYRRADGADALSGRSGAGRQGGWDIRQVHTGSDPAEVNEAILEDLAGGATSVAIVMAGARFPGLAPDAATLKRALDGVLLDVCPIALDAGARTVEAAAALVAVWEGAGLATEKRLGAFNFDPIGRLASSGALPMSAEAAMAAAGKLVASSVAMPHVTALRANGHVWHRAGASEAQELGLTLATLVAYLRAAEAAGVAPDTALGKIAVCFAVDADQLMGLAKLRAARSLIARVADACGAGAGAAHVAVGAETSERMMSRRDPWVNMLRTTMACTIAAFGGADSIMVLPFSWPLGAPDAFARRMARNTSIVLAEESGLGRVTDPAAGSFAIEALTRDLAQTAWGEFQAIEKAGGIVAALASGMVQTRVAKTAAARAKLIATGKLALTGTSAFPRLGDDGVKVTPWPKSTASAASGAGATVSALTQVRDAAPFEALRDVADAFAAKTGAAPKMFLACLGPLPSHGARAQWMRNFLAAGGIDSVSSGEILQSQDAGRLFAESGASVACLCASDTTYAELGDAAIMALKGAGAASVYIAGRPKASEAALTSAGADGFIASGDDMLIMLAALQVKLGVGG